MYYVTVLILVRYFVLLGIKYGDAKDFNKVWELYQCEQNPQEKINLLKALLYSSDLTLLAK